MSPSFRAPIQLALDHTVPANPLNAVAGRLWRCILDRGLLGIADATEGEGVISNRAPVAVDPGEFVAYRADHGCALGFATFGKKLWIHIAVLVVVCRRKWLIHRAICDSCGNANRTHAKAGAIFETNG
jgi:hypothetical protein